MKAWTPLLLALTLLAPLAYAQENGAAAAPAKPAGKPVEAEQGGITIFGDKETPVGLFLTPWKEGASAAGLDRPARLLDEAALPVDRATFHRQFDYSTDLADYRRLDQSASAGH